MNMDHALRDVLLVEDDERLAELIADYLRGHGYVVTIEPRGDLAAARIAECMPALLLLDVSLPGKDGFDVCREIRGWYRGIILILTARTDDIDHVLGLELGADDYIAKPIAPRVLLARIKAHLRRQESPEPQEQDALAFGNLHIDSRSREVTLAGNPVPCTDTEFDLLWLLATNAGSILSRDDLSIALRGIEFDGLDRSIDARVSRLRRKIDEHPDEPDRIKTVRGRGYLFNGTGGSS